MEGARKYLGKLYSHILLTGIQIKQSHWKVVQQFLTISQNSQSKLLPPELEQPTDEHGESHLTCRNL